MSFNFFPTNAILWEISPTVLPELDKITDALPCPPKAVVEVKDEAEAASI